VVAQPAEGWLHALAGKLWAPLLWMLEATILLELLGHQPQALLILLLLMFNAVLGSPRRRAPKTPLSRCGGGVVC